MAPKKTIHHKDIVAKDRQAPVQPRWKPVVEFDGHVVYDRAQFKDASGSWDKQKLYDLKQTHPDKNIVFTEAGSPTVFVERKAFALPAQGATPEYVRKISAIKRFGKAITYYDSPASNPSANAFHEEAKPKRLTDVPESKIKKLSTSQEVLKRDKLAIEGKFAPGDTHVDSVRHKRTDEVLTEKQRRSTAVLDKKDKELVVRERKAKRAKRKKVAVRRKATHVAHGATFVKGKRLGENQFVARSGRAYYLSKQRSAARIALAQKRYRASEVASLKREAFAGIKGVSQRSREIESRRQAAAKFERFKVQKATRAGERVVAYGKRLGGLQGFGQVPLKMLMQREGLSGNAPGKRAVMSSLSHGEKYPARNLSGTGAFSASAAGRQTLIDAPEKLRRSVAGASMFRTTNTQTTSKFPDGGNGIFFRIDAEAVIANLVQHYPAVLQQAAIASADSVGRKMLDIVEPYIPKDTGLLYSSGQTNVSQTSSELVDFAGAEAYPAGQMFGVSISYDAPYASIVYFDESNAHGAEYNRKHGTSEKDERETARWIEVAFQKEKAALKGLLVEQAAAITAALSRVGGKAVSFTRASGKSVSFVAFKR